MTITVNDYASPIVSAGSDQSVNTGSPVSLAGSASQADSHTLTYLWSQTGGTAVLLSNAALLNPTFTAPNAPTALTFTLTATDTQNPVPAAASTTSGPVTVTVNDSASPIVGSGSNQSVKTGSAVSLAGSASQADNHTLTYLWSQTGGTAVSLSDATALNPSFTAPNAPDGVDLHVDGDRYPEPKPGGGVDHEHTGDDHRDQLRVAQWCRRVVTSR